MGSSGANLSGTYQTLDEAFDMPASLPSVSNTNWSTFSANSVYLRGMALASTGAQNAEVVFELPGLLKSGTWTFALEHRTGGSGGIFTVAASPDGSAWTTLGTVDNYQASATTTRTAVTGVTMPALTAYLRLQMLTKNGASSNYTGELSGITGRRTGA